LQSEIDSSLYGNAVGRALNVKGGLNVPNSINVDNVIPIVDVLQGGFARYEILNGGVLISAGGSIQTLTVFDPTAEVTDLDNKINNRDFEIRILFMEVQLEGLLAADYSNDDRLVLTVRMEMQGSGPAIDGDRIQGIRWLKRWKANLAPDGFIWSLPSSSGQGIIREVMNRWM